LQRKTSARPSAVSKVLSENRKKSLENIQTASGDFQELVAKNKDNVGRIVNNLEAISKDIEGGKGTIGKLVKDDTLYNDAKEVVATLKNVSKDIEEGKGTFGKLAKDEALYTDVRKAVDNITEITDGIKKGEGTFGKLAKDESLYTETEKAVKKVQKAAEGIQELTPITILSTIFGTFF
jgi:phospholipid/cholesterol/gamma-HCH transport system substrate-binding protein